MTYYVACCQTNFACPSNRNDIINRTKAMGKMLEQTLVGYQPFFDVRLFTFPEFAHCAPIYDNIPQLKQQLALEIPNEHTDYYHKLCQKHGCYIQTGSFIEYDDHYPEVLFNTTLLIGPTGILSKYRKTNPWIPWEVHASPHDIKNYPDNPFPVVDTELGKLGVAICYDWLFPETIRQIAFQGAEVVIRISAYMDPWGSNSPLEWWSLFNRTRAIENTVYVVAVNQGASLKNYPPFSWPGSSMIVDFDGRILAQAEAGAGEKVVVAPINISQLREERQRRQGHDMQAHCRSELYHYLQTPYLAPSQQHPISVENIKQRIQQSKQQLNTPNHNLKSKSKTKS